MNPYIELDREEHNSYSFLCKALNNKDYKIFALAGDASTRKYYRVLVDESTSVLMAWEPFDLKNYPFISVQKHFRKNQVNVPKVLATAPKQGFVLLEDLGDLTLERRFWETQDQSHILPFYKLAVDELIKIHYHATDNVDRCTAFDIAFDTEKLLWEMNYTRKHLLQGLCGIDISPASEKVLNETFLDICQKLDKQERRICHRDYHSRNLMLKFGLLRVIDFQDARMGPIQYDLVSLLKDSYVALEEANCNILIEYYLNKSQDYTGKTLNRDQFDEVFVLQTIQRCFKACGSFASFKMQREDNRYLKYLHPTLKHIQSALEQSGQFPEFNKFLTDQGLFSRRFETR